MSKIEQLILKYKTLPWDWSSLSANPSVSFSFILDHPTLPWIPRYVSMNPNITESDVRGNLTYPWVFSELCRNANMSLSFYEEFMILPVSVYRVEWSLISANPSISMIDVINNPLYKWDIRYLSANPSLNSNFILNEGRRFNWFVPFVCSNPGITERDIYKSTMKDLFSWDYNNLSSNVNLPIAFVNNNMQEKWNYHSISTHVSLHDVHTYQQIPWDRFGLSINPNISFDHVCKSEGWYYQALLANSSIDVSTIEDNYEWFENRMDRVDSIRSYVCSNPTISLEWISQHIREIDWKRLSRNPLIR